MNAQGVHIEPNKDPFTISQVSPGDLTPSAGSSNRRWGVSPAPGTVFETPWLPSVCGFNAANWNAVEDKVGDDVAVEDCGEAVYVVVVTYGATSVHTLVS